MGNTKANPKPVTSAPALISGALCFQITTDDGKVPEWVELIPAPDSNGQIIGRDGRTWTMPDAAAVAARFDLPVPVDINHATEVSAPAGGEAPARAWIEQLQARNGALWGRMRWTDAGAELVRTLAYRFLSPAFDFMKMTGEIWKLKSVGLVNDPNFSLALNRRSEIEEPEMSLKAIAAALALPETATEAECITAINTRKTELETARNAASAPDLAKYVPRADYDNVLQRATNAETKLTTAASEKRDADIEVEISSALKAGKITPATADHHRATCKQEGGLERFREYVKATPVIVSDEETRKPNATADNASAKDISGRALNFQKQQADLGRHVSIADAVTHVTAQAQ